MVNVSVGEEVHVRILRWIRRIRVISVVQVDLQDHFPDHSMYKVCYQ